jgi:hypothetical protein
MPCCGKRSASYPEAGGVDQTPNAAGAAAGISRRVLRDKVFFEYLGDKNLTVIGSVSGKRYRFTGPGSFVEVDLRDRRSVAAVPKLRELR